MQNLPSLVKGGIGKDRERREGKVERVVRTRRKT